MDDCRRLVTAFEGMAKDTEAQFTRAFEQYRQQYTEHLLEPLRRQVEELSREAVARTTLGQELDGYVAQLNQLVTALYQDEDSSSGGERAPAVGSSQLP